MLADIQEAFRKAVLDPATAMPCGLAAHNGVAPRRQFSIFQLLSSPLSVPVSSHRSVCNKAAVPLEQGHGPIP